MNNFLPPGLEAWGPANEMVGPDIYNYHLWIKKIKEALDPNDAIDSWGYSGAVKDRTKEETDMFST